MGLPRIFKKKVKEVEVKEKEKAKERPPEGVVEGVVEVRPQQPSQQPTQQPKGREKKMAGVYCILKSPHVTEKVTDLTKENQYVFKVYPETHKTEIKKAIENLYGVDVLDVKIINVPRKRRRLGRISGWRKGYKKAIIKIKEGQKIEVLPR